MASGGGLSGVSGLAVAATAAGALLIWSGLKGRSVTTSLRSLISGQPPPSVTAFPVTLDTSFTDPSSGGGSAPNLGVSGGPNGIIASDAMKYNGAGYVWGGDPHKGRGNWDCSSFVNWVVGHDLGMAIPGHPNGVFAGHGPTTLQWIFFGKKISRAEVTAGDIVVWQTHMGIAISNKQMISARSASSNPPTGIDNITGDIPGEIPSYRRL